MKIHLLTIIFTTTIFFGCKNIDQSSSTSDDKNIFERIVLDLNGDKIKDTILLLDPETAGDPGSFKRIQVRGKGMQTFELSANTAWDTIAKKLRKNNDPECRTDFIFIKRHKKTTYILLTGWQYPTGQEDFALLAIKNDKCSVLTTENFNSIVEFADLNDDDELEIVLNPFLPEYLSDIDSLNATILSYTPFYVYRLTPNSFSIDTLLMTGYNSKNYLWAGLDSIAKTKVIWFKDKNKYDIYKE